jgi:NTP pyrophosphatase (non-canonical NTP hydrolase)
MSELPLTPDEYQALAFHTAQNIQHMDPLVAWALEIAEESGEVVKLVKKWKVRQRTDIDPDDIAEEVGDLIWCACALLSQMGYKLSDVMQANIDKLTARYQGGGFVIDEERDSVPRSAG